VLGCAECPALGKLALYRAQDFAECGARQNLLCRVPDKRHSAKPPALGKGPDSGSDIKGSYPFIYIKGEVLIRYKSVPELIP
jgi:hypothetical protein